MVVLTPFMTKASKAIFQQRFRVYNAATKNSSFRCISHLSEPKHARNRLIKQSDCFNYSIPGFSNRLSSSTTIMKGVDLSNPECNIPQSIASRLGTNLHLQKNHPLNTIKDKIEDYWHQRSIIDNKGFETYADFEPIVSTDDNFDSLLIPSDHVSRSKSDTYYVDQKTVLRTHTSAHQTTLLKQGVDRFLVTGDVYR